MCIVQERRPAGFLDMKCQTCYIVTFHLSPECQQLVHVAPNTGIAVGHGGLEGQKHTTPGSYK